MFFIHFFVFSILKNCMRYSHNNIITVIKNKKRNPYNFLKILGTYGKGKEHSD